MDKLQQANNNIENLIDVLVNKRKEYLNTGICCGIYDNSPNEDKNCDNCIKCKQNYLVNYRKNLIEKYIVK